LTDVQIPDQADRHSLASTESRKSSDAGLSGSTLSRRPSKGYRLIEVPLTSDSEFFDLLQTSLSGLAHLQDEERHKIHDEITEVGKVLVKAVEPTSRSGRADLDHWRRIFELYMDSRVFFNVGERNHGVQQFAAAQDRYNKFLSTAQKANLLKKFKRKESMNALQHFLNINMELLQNLRFQEINHTAMVKILKSKPLTWSFPFVILIAYTRPQNSTSAPRSTQNLLSQLAQPSPHSPFQHPSPNPSPKKSPPVSSPPSPPSTTTLAQSAPS
jgi:E3 ubiquitin-protein ligase BAH